MAKLDIEAEKLRNKLIQLNVQKSKLSEDGNMSNFVNWLKNAGRETENNIKKVGKWALALFGIRSIYTGIRGAVNNVTQYNEQLKADIDYLGYAIATVLEPVVKFIVDLVYKLLTLINIIVNALFGINLFSKATAKNFANANSSARSLKKTLAGFDEMNVLNEDGSVGSGGGGSSYKPSIDLSDSLNSDTADKIKNWWKQIYDFWEKDFANFDYSFAGDWQMFLEGLIMLFKGFWDTIKGVLQSFWGIGEMIVGLLTGDEELIKKGWEDLKTGLYNILVGICEMLLGVLATIVGFLKGLVLWIWHNVLEKLWNLAVENMAKTLSGTKNFLDKIVGYWKSGMGTIGNFFSGIWNGIIGWFSTGWNKFKSFIDKMVGYWKSGWQTIGDFFGGIANGIKSGFNALVSFVKGIINILIDGLNVVIKGLNKIKFDTPNWVPGIGGKSFGINIPTIKKLEKGGIINLPGRGVPIGGAIGGERRQEGVLPLTDSQQMSLLGQAIGKYVNINATIPIYMGNRQIAREMKKITAEDDFAFNS